MTVLQLRHENVSKLALCSSDLLLIIASPQSGQCRIGGRSGGGKNAESTGHDEGHDHIGGHRIAPYIRGARWRVPFQHLHMPRASTVSSLSANFRRFLIYLNFRNPCLPHLLADGNRPTTRFGNDNHLIDALDGVLQSSSPPAARLQNDSEGVRGHESCRCDGLQRHHCERERDHW